MNVEIDYLIETTERLIKRFKDSRELEIGIVLLCALELFKKEKEREKCTVKKCHHMKRT